MAEEATRKKRTNASHYLILKRDGTFLIVEKRKDLGGVVAEIGVGKIRAVYRGTKLAFRLVQDVEIGPAIANTVPSETK